MLKSKLAAVGILYCLLSSLVVLAQTRGVGVRVKGSNGQTKEVKLYDNSFALVIGESNYINGWDALVGVSSDVIAVKQILELGGFKVETAENLTSLDFDSRIKKFIDDYGFEPNNRILIYYAGHGHTLKSSGDGRELGYVVPVDAPDPSKDERGFRRKAISMDIVQTYAKQIQAKHAMFIFDSCFSGKLVSRNAIVIPPIIEESVAFPVRQFITAGAANQPVPDESIFRRSFVRGLEGEADRNRDGYITGTELADFLKEKVTNYSNRAQTPQYGKINDVELDKGDFVFVVGKNQTVPTTTAQNENPVVAKDSVAVEREAWSYIKDSSDPQDFRSFLTDFPNGANAGNAKIKLEQSVWDAVKNSGDKGKLQGYLNEFPSGVNAPLAKIRIRQLDVATTTNPNNSPSTTPTNPNLTSGAITVGMSVTNSLGMKLMGVPAGTFQMGSNGQSDEKIHTVTLSQGFYMGRTEVTQAQWVAVMGSNPSYFKNCDNCPVEQVSWDDVQEFIRKLNAKGEGVYRLPTEAEWEYAARAGTTGDYAGNLDSMAWYSANAGGKTHEVATKQANAWGLYDMHGNVWEWVADWYGSYPSGSVSNPTGATSGSGRVDRGGGWFSDAGSARSADRISNTPSDRLSDLGFRVVRN